MNRKLLRRMTLPLIAACLALADCSTNTTTSAGPPTAFAVMRLTSTGGRDITFGSGGAGFVTTNIDTTLFDFALAGAIQPADNKIIAGGSNGLAGQGTIALVRYIANGTLDASGFGIGGIVRTPTPAGWTSASASAIAVQLGDGKIVVAALAFNQTAGTTGIILLRYNTDGTLDTTGFGTSTGFGTFTGFVIANIGPGNMGDTCGLALQPADGKILVAGASTSGNIVLNRYNPDGSPDMAFGTAGTTTTSLGTSVAAASPALALQSGGKIVVATGVGDFQNGPADQVVLRYNTGGTLDTGFGPSGANGIVVTDINATLNFGNAVAVQSDDKIVIAGHANVNFASDTSDISLVRYNLDGTLDLSFNPTSLTPGIVTTDLGGFDNTFSVALQSPAAANTAILVSGNTGSGGFSQATALRYNTDGSPDMSFGNGGVVVAPIFGPSSFASGNTVLQSTLGIVVMGYD